MKKDITITPVSGLRGTLTVPGDKSISHRAVMLASLSEGVTEIEGFLDGADCRSTIDCFAKMGVVVEKDGDILRVHGKGLYGLTKPSDTLYTGNSGTTTRIISGILAGQNFSSRLTGDASIEKRPMKRIIEPLRMMGADIISERGNDCAPLVLQKSALKGISYRSPVSSAQVKSCIMFAGLYADSMTTVTEPALSRDHTERMMRAFGAKIVTGIDAEKRPCASVEPAPRFSGGHVIVPSDISSAAYFIVAGLIVPHSEIMLKNVNTNPTRAGIIEVLKRMGADLRLENERVVSGEPVADIVVRSSELNATEIDGNEIPTLIDELPVIAVAAAFANGRTVIRDAAELKVKESNRIESVSKNLSAMGADVTPTDDGLIIQGGSLLHGAEIATYHDHRIAMSFAVAGLLASGDTTFDDTDCVAVSYPSFFDDIASISI